ncbi:ribonuclease H-like domain-containing protein [Apodospora peruviana]|uniref:ribonuclease H n=1 Tax=Apodospora peruviana TaxID=516989 RepID=A0AAE0M868_9PEZI|nr:ribonuclease H-like domain-containing protein [Apodospora peruviana]
MDVLNLIQRYDPTQDPSLPSKALYDPNSQILQLYANKENGSLNFIEGSLVIYVDGGCRGDEFSSNARAAYGVFAGPGSRYNRADLVAKKKNKLEQTSTRAEIEALSRGVDVVRQIMLRKAYVKDVYIATDSEYLVKAMTEWMPKWLKSGGRRADDGGEVAHFSLLVDIFLRLNAIYYAAGGEKGQGKPVKLWHVPREQNVEANRLVDQILDECGH